MPPSSALEGRATVTHPGDNANVRLRRGVQCSGLDHRRGLMIYPCFFPHSYVAKRCSVQNVNIIMNADLLKLYLATDDRWIDSEESCTEIVSAVRGGVTMVQLRLKHAKTSLLFRLGEKLLQELRPYNVPLIINDRVDIMLALGAEGVHIGRGDLPLPEVRRLTGAKIVGYSVNTLEHLYYAEANGADYVGVGPVFSTGTKTDTGPVLGQKGLAAIIEAAHIPCVAIGGVNTTNVDMVMAAGAAGCCVVSAVLGATDPRQAADELYKRISKS